MSIYSAVVAASARRLKSSGFDDDVRLTPREKVLFAEIRELQVLLANELERNGVAADEAMD